MSAAGRRRCRPLAAQLAAYEPNAIVSSTEPKAAETAELIGARLELAVELRDGLREHGRRSLGWLESGAFERGVRRLFEQPDEVVFGDESAAEALARFSAAVGDLDGPVIVVSHGTVISLYAAARTGRDPFEIWRGLELPDVVVL